MNIGFTEAQLLQEKYQCLILHDVDMLPEHDGNLIIGTITGNRNVLETSLCFHSFIRWNCFVLFKSGVLGLFRSSDESSISANDFQGVGVVKTISCVIVSAQSISMLSELLTVGLYLKFTTGCCLTRELRPIQNASKCSKTDGIDSKPTV